MLEIKDICFKKDNKQILNHINLTFDENKFYVITGPNGSGKSTLVKIIMGIEKPDSGQILFNGEDITNLNVAERAKKKIAFAFQQPVRFKGITVFDLLNLAAGKKLDKKGVCQILSKVGLCANEYVDREVNNSLSGGELKRIEIASVIARDPKLAIFDEPEAGIDLWSFQNLIKVFKSFSKETAGITLVISHQERILNIADEIILLESGQIKEISRDKEILKNILNTSKCCERSEKFYE